MAGNRAPRVVLQNRDRHLLREVAVMRFIDREQAKVAVGFSSTTRANSRLLLLTIAGFLRRFFVGSIAGGRKAIYSLTSKGAAAVSVGFRDFSKKQKESLAANLFLEHQMRINSIYLAVKYSSPSSERFHFHKWISFREPLSRTVSIVPDGYFELNSPNGISPMFVEVDLGTEPQRIWKRKIDGYLQLAISGEFQNIFRQPRFRVLVIATSEHRLKGIRAGVAKETDKIFWLSTFDLIQREGFWSPIWLRPKGDQKQSLL